MTWPAEHHLRCRQGADYDRTFRWFTDAPAGARHRGNWDTTITYLRDDLTVHSGTTYRALATTTGEIPASTPAAWTALTPTNLTGWDARMHIRRRTTDTTTLLALDAPPVAGQGITLGGTAGTIRVQIPNATTATLPVGAWPYDLELISAAGIVTPFLCGRVIVDPEVTR